LHNVSFGDELYNAGLEDSLASAYLGTADSKFEPTAIPAPFFAAGHSSAFSIDEANMTRDGFNTSRSNNVMNNTTTSFAIPSPFLPKEGSRLKAISQLSGNMSSISPRVESGLGNVNKVTDTEARIQRKISRIHTHFEKIDGSIK
jgi:hypothetical protein